MIMNVCEAPNSCKRGDETQASKPSLRGCSGDTEGTSRHGRQHVYDAHDQYDGRAFKEHNNNYTPGTILIENK